LPLPVLFLFAVLAGTGIAALTAAPSTRGISQRLEQTEESIKGYLSSSASSLISRLEVTRRKLGPVSRGEAVLFGLTPRELAVLLLCAGAYTLAFLLKDRLLIRWDTFLILVGAGALTTIVHQLAHREAARRAGQTAELQFWGLGTTMLVLSAWIFGYLFASPSRNLFQKGEEPSLRTNAMISLAGPAMSLALGMVSLLLVPLGGVAAFAGRTLFTMNLMNGVYSLVPFDPMDGKPIFDWNRSAWAAIFFPLLAVYAAFYLL
jgi:Zn-dependent protease